MTNDGHMVRSRKHGSCPMERRDCIYPDCLVVSDFGLACEHSCPCELEYRANRYKSNKGGMISQRDKPGQGVPNQQLDDLNKEIKQAETLLRELWARRRALRAQGKLRRIPLRERKEQILRLIKIGKALAQI